MPELDPFEIRVAAAVRSLADRADTRVDAAELAARAMRRRGGIAGWLGRTVPVPVFVLLLLVLLGVAAWSTEVGGLLRFSSSIAPAPVVTPPSTPSPTPAPTPAATQGAHLSGTNVLAVVSAGETTQAGDVSQIRGIVVTTTETADDPRATGTGTFHLSVDASGAIGFEWGTARIENADGAWEGTCSGASWNNGDASDVSCWLTGSGGYEGFTYYWHGRNAGTQGDVVGTIVPAPAPSP